MVHKQIYGNLYKYNINILKNEENKMSTLKSSKTNSFSKFLSTDSSRLN